MYAIQSHTITEAQICICLIGEIKLKTAIPVNKDNLLARM